MRRPRFKYHGCSDIHWCSIWKWLSIEAFYLKSVIAWRPAYLPDCKVRVAPWIIAAKKCKRTLWDIVWFFWSGTLDVDITFLLIIKCTQIHEYRSRRHILTGCFIMPFHYRVAKIQVKMQNATVCMNLRSEILQWFTYGNGLNVWSPFWCKLRQLEDVLEQSPPHIYHECPWNIMLCCVLPGSVTSCRFALTRSASNRLLPSRTVTKHKKTQFPYQDRA